MSDREWTARELFNATMKALGRTPEVSGLAYSTDYVGTVAHDLATSLGLKIKEELPRAIAIRTMLPAESVVIMDAATGRPISASTVDEVARRYRAVELALHLLVDSPAVNAHSRDGLRAAVLRILQEGGR